MDKAGGSLLRIHRRGERGTQIPESGQWTSGWLHTSARHYLSGLTMSVSMAPLSICAGTCLSESIKEISSLPFLCSCLHVCVSLQSSSLMSIRGTSMTLWILELNLPLSQHRPFPQDAMPRCGLWGCGQGGPWWAACPYQGLRSICGVQPLPDQSHKGPRGICNSTLLPCPPLLQTLLCLPCGGGAVFLLYLRVCFLVFALICLHLSLCQSL